LLLTKALPNELSALKKNVKDAHEQLAQTKKMIEENVKNQKTKEMDIQSNIEKINKYKNQLLSIKSNKEYKALNSEISHLEKKNSEIDDLRVDLMEEEEMLREQLKTHADISKKADNELQANQDRIEKQIEDVQKDIENLKEKRNKLAYSLPKSIIKRYALLIKHKDRKAVAHNHNGACSACGFRIRPQLIIEINKGEAIESCENCGRMLVYKLDE
jgi:predicted  nucleic acid-binding Zn-ribbon protein